MPDEKMFLISQSTAQAILNYLGECPAGKVYAMITAMLNLQPAPVVINVEEPKKEEPKFVDLDNIPLKPVEPVV